MPSENLDNGQPWEYTNECQVNNYSGSTGRQADTLPRVLSSPAYQRENQRGLTNQINSNKIREQKTRERGTQTDDSKRNRKE